MLLEIAVADAWGCGFEYAPREHFVHNTLSLDTLNFVCHPTRRDLAPGQYSDDTQMSLAVAEVLLSSDDPTQGPWAERYKRSFYDCYRRDPRKGYSRGFQKLLDDAKSSDELWRAIVPLSEKNGAAMRACPIGLISEYTGVVASVAREQAVVTHNTFMGVDAAMTVAKAVCLLRSATPYQKLVRKRDLWDALCEHDEHRNSLCIPVDSPMAPPGDIDRVGGWAFESVRVAIECVVTCDTMVDVIRKAVSYRGDTDTTAAIAAGIASVCPDIDQRLPPGLLDVLENGSYGRDYLIDLDKRLFARFPKFTAAS